MSAHQWSMCRVRDIAAESDRAIAIGPFGSSLRADAYSPSGVPVLRGQNIGPLRTLDLSDLVHVPELVAAKFPACIVGEHDLIFPHRGAIGRVGLVPKGQFLLSSSMMKLTVNRSVVDPVFVFYYFRGPGKYSLLERASTVGTPGIGQPLTSLRDIPISYPPLGTQRAIAEVLGALDDKIAANAKLVEASQRLMLATGEHASSTIDVESLAAAVKRQLKPREFSAEVAHFSLPAFDVGPLPDVCQGDEIKSNKFVLDQPCVLVSKLNPRIPRVWNVPVVPDLMALASTEFVVLRPTTVDVSELWAVMAQPSVSTELRGRVSGTSGSHQRAKPADILSLTVSDPRTLGDRHRKLLASLGTSIHHIRMQEATLTKLRDTLLPGLMSGRITVKDAERTAEEVL